EGERGALARSVRLGPDAAAHRFDERLGDGQPYARPAVCSAARLVDAVETVEYPREFIPRNADTAVTDAELNRATKRTHAQANLPRGRRLAHGVGRQVAQHLNWAVGIRRHAREALGDLWDERQALLSERGCEPIEHRSRKLGWVDLLDREGNLARLG